MARFANSVMFTPASAGTANFVVSAAVVGYMTPALAGAPTGIYKYRAESNDLSEWEIGEGTYTSGTTTLTRTTVLYNNAGTGTASGQSGAGSKINFTNPPNVGIVQTVEDTLGIDQANAFTAAQRSQARSNISATLRGQLFGLTLSAAGSTATYGVAAGECADSTAVDLMVLGSAYTKTVAAWAVGTGNGSLDTGSIAASTTYHFFVIKRPDTGVVDLLISTSPTAPTLPANYTIFRRIGSMKTNSSSQWAKMYQIGDDFFLDTTVMDFDNNTIGTARTSITLGSVPTGILVMPYFRAFFFGTSGANQFALLTDLNTNGVAASFLVAPGITIYDNSNIGGAVGQPMRIYTNTSGQIGAQASQASSRLRIATYGWCDQRDRT